LLVFHKRQGLRALAHFEAGGRQEECFGFHFGILRKNDKAKGQCGFPARRGAPGELPLARGGEGGFAEHGMAHNDNGILNDTYAANSDGDGNVPMDTACQRERRIYRSDRNFDCTS